MEAGTVGRSSMTKFQQSGRSKQPWIQALDLSTSSKGRRDLVGVNECRQKLCRVTHVCFMTSGCLCISTTSSASSMVNGRMSSLCVLAVVFGSTTTIFASYGLKRSHGCGAASQSIIGFEVKMQGPMQSYSHRALARFRHRLLMTHPSPPRTRPA